MNTKPFTSRRSGGTVLVVRVADGLWHALEDDLVVGRGHVGRRPDGRLFVSIDACCVLQAGPGRRVEVPFG